MQDINDINMEMVNDLNFTKDMNQGRIMYRDYCSSCYMTFNMFDFLEKHHFNLRTRKELISYYYTMRDKIAHFIKRYKEGNACNCYVFEIVISEDNDITGEREVQYNIYSEQLFLHYDYLQLDPVRLSQMEGPVDEDVVHRVTHWLTNMQNIDSELMLDTGYVENDDDLNDWIEENANQSDQHTPQEELQDRLIPIDEFLFETPSFVVGDDILPLTPDQPTQQLQPDTPLHVRAITNHTSIGEETVTDARRRLDFDHIEIQEEQLDDIELWIRNLNIVVGAQNLEHPILTRLLQNGHQQLPQIAPVISMYSSEFRLNHRLSQKNFLIKTYEEDQEGIYPPTIRVYRDIPALIQELQIWLEYFEKNHEAVVNTTILSLQNKLVPDCIYKVLKFV